MIIPWSRLSYQELRQISVDTKTLIAKRETISSSPDEYSGGTFQHLNLG